nr:hypothetical protein [uncultured Defluviimonas sp.]
MPLHLHFARANAPWLSAGFLLTCASSFGLTFFKSILAGDIRYEFGRSHAGWGLSMRRRPWLLRRSWSLPAA